MLCLICENSLAAGWRVGGDQDDDELPHLFLLIASGSFSIRCTRSASVVYAILNNRLQKYI